MLENVINAIFRPGSWYLILMTAVVATFGTSLMFLSSIFFSRRKKKVSPPVETLQVLSNEGLCSPSRTKSLKKYRRMSFVAEIADKTADFDNIPQLRQAIMVCSKMLTDLELTPAQQEDLEFMKKALEGQREAEEKVFQEFERQVAGANHIDAQTKDYLLTFRENKAVAAAVARFMGRGPSLEAGFALRSASFRRTSTVPSTPNGMQAPPADLLDALDNIDSWHDFNVFRVAKLTNNQPLLYTVWDILNKRDILKSLPIREEALKNWIIAIEHGYVKESCSYHNNVHAADVTQALHCILNWFPEGTFSDLEVLAAILAAACHDFEHRGLTNKYLQDSCDPRAIRYNNKSVNESHHIAAAMQVVLGLDGKGKTPCNFLAEMSVEQSCTLRQLMIRMVLCTDMELHFKQLADFDKLCNSGIDLKKDDDTHTALTLALHCADISNAARPIQFAAQWADRVTQEFFAQGDLEKAAGREVSPLCDRDSVKLASSQLGFINYIVQPSFTTLSAVCNTAAITAQMEKNARFWKEHADCVTFRDIEGFVDEESRMAIRTLSI